MSPKRIPDADLRADLQAVADELGRTPAKGEYAALGQYSGTTQRQRFGSWHAAVRAAGLEPRGRSHGGTAFHNAKYAHLVGSESRGEGA